MDRIVNAIVRSMHRRARPTYLGELSSDIGHSLEVTDGACQLLISDGSLRSATDEERATLDAPEGASLYALVGRASVRLASF